MPEETTAPAATEEKPEVDAPETDAPDTGTSDEETFTDSYNPNAIQDDAARAELEKAYNQLRSDYTRKTGELGEQRREAERALALEEALRDPDRQIEVLRQLGYEVEDLEPNNEADEDDPNARVTRVEQYLAQREEAEKHEADERREKDWVKENLDALLKKDNIEVTDQERRLIENDAKSNRFDDGQPDLEGALQAYTEATTAARERYLESKKAARIGTGSAGHKKFDPSNEDDRLAAMREIMEAESEGS